MLAHCAAAWLLLASPVSAQTTPAKPVAQSTPDVQTIDRDVLTRRIESPAAADVDRLIEVVFKVGARIEGSPNGPSAADARRELDRLRDEIAAIHGRVRSGGRGDAATYQRLQKELLALAERVGSPLR